MLLIIGLDGADWNILEPWLRSGDLPNLAGLRARGRWGNLRSTIRPESSTAWSTFATGVNPGKHGVFGFSGQRPGTYETTLNTAAAIQSPSFWARAGAAGKRVAVLNTPMTYPPQPFANGAVVAGMLTPGTRSDFTYPAGLRQGLLAAAPGYSINVDRTGLDARRFIRETAAAIRARAQAGLWLLAQDAWDAFAIVFTASDRLQHYTLHLLAPGHPRHDPAEAEALLPDLLAAYQAIDEAVGQLLAAAGPDASIILLSDHGFAPCSRRFHINNWLQDQGLLARAERAAPSPGLRQRLRANPAARRLKNAMPGLRDVRRAHQPANPFSGVDWTRTEAVYSPAGGIRLNIRGREPQGILSPDQAEALAADLTAALLDAVDPGTGAKPIVAAYSRDDLYHGPHIDLAPDLILEPRRADPDPALNTALPNRFAPEAFRSSEELSGNHTLDGIILAAGPGIPTGKIENARLLDLASTLLHALDLPLPAHLDGQALPLWSAPKPAVWEDAGGDTDQHPTKTPAPFSAEDQAAVEERLRGLGYL